MATVQEAIIDAAFTELGVKPVDQPLGPNESTWGFSKLNRLLGQWATRRLFVAYMSFTAYTFSASQQSYSIGPSGADFTATRPVRIERANLVIVADSPDTEMQLEVINTDDYASLNIPALSSTIPTRLYYQATYPNGTLWPRPYPTTTTNKLRLFVWNQITEYAALSDTVTLPPGYLDAIVLSLAESMLAQYPTVAAAQYIIDGARRARAAIQGLNSVLPNIGTADGFKNGGRQTPYWNYKTGLP